MAVIVVDDEKFDRYLVRRTLREVSPDMSLIEMQDGRQFLDFLGTSNFDDTREYPPETLILLDINMPRATGFEVLEQLKALRDEGHSSARCVVVMMFTSSENEEDKNRAFSYEFVKDYIVKPIDHGQLDRLIGIYQPGNRDAA